MEQKNIIKVLYGLGECSDICHVAAQYNKLRFRFLQPVSKKNNLLFFSGASAPLTAGSRMFPGKISREVKNSKLIGKFFSGGEL